MAYREGEAMNITAQIRLAHRNCGAGSQAAEGHSPLTFPAQIMEAHHGCL